MKVLILGYKSFAANRLLVELEKKGVSVDCFTRGKESKKDNIITGNVFDLNNNQFLKFNKYDYVINFIIIKNSSVEENLRYLKSLHEFCNKNTRNLLHISNPNESNYINENSIIETNINKKGNYAKVKIASDIFLKGQIKNYQVSFLRPGYIVDKKVVNKFSGIAIFFLNKFAVLLGNKYSSLPLIEKGNFHEAILEICLSSKLFESFIFCDNFIGTKLQFLKSNFKGKVLCSPGRVVKYSAQFAKYIVIINESLLQQILRLLKTTYFVPHYQKIG